MCVSSCLEQIGQLWPFLVTIIRTDFICHSFSSNSVSAENKYGFTNNLSRLQRCLRSCSISSVMFSAQMLLFPVPLTDSTCFYHIWYLRVMGRHQQIRCGIIHLKYAGTSKKKHTFFLCNEVRLHLLSVLPRNKVVQISGPPTFCLVLKWSNVSLKPFITSCTCLVVKSCIWLWTVIFFLVSFTFFKK